MFLASAKCICGRRVAINIKNLMFSSKPLPESTKALHPIMICTYLSGASNSSWEGTA